MAISTNQVFDSSLTEKFGNQNASLHEQSRSIGCKMEQSGCTYTVQSKWSCTALNKQAQLIDFDSRDCCSNAGIKGRLNSLTLTIKASISSRWDSWFRNQGCNKYFSQFFKFPELVISPIMYCLGRGVFLLHYLGSMFLGGFFQALMEEFIGFQRHIIQPRKRLS
jgi:hypothetical protein